MQFENGPAAELLFLDGFVGTNTTKTSIVDSSVTF